MSTTRIFWAARETAPAHVVIGGLATAGVLRLVGVPPIDLHGPLNYLGVMDPFPGGTRAAYLLTSGDLAGAWRYNPIAFVLAAAAAVLARAAVGRLGGRWLDVRLSKRARHLGTAAMVLGLAVLEVRQQLLVELLTQPLPGGSSAPPLHVLIGLLTG